ncbi:MAG: TSUP family transporter [Aestuariivirgaceae bacterium]
MLTEAILLIAVFAFLFAGTIKGIIGIGLPTATIAVLAQFTDPRHAVALLLLPALVTNVWQVHRSGYLTKGIRQFWPFAVVLAPMIWLSSHYAARAPAELLTLGVGCVVVLFVITNLIAKPYTIPARLDRPVQAAAGAIAGIMGGLTSIWAPPMVIYLLAKQLTKDEFVGATGLLILAGTVPLLAGYVQTGLMTSQLAIYSAAMVAPTWIGFAAGEYLRGKLNTEQFRYVFLVIFLLMGLNLIRKALF